MRNLTTTGAIITLTAVLTLISAACGDSEGPAADGGPGEASVVELDSSGDEAKQQRREPGTATTAPAPAATVPDTTVAAEEAPPAVLPPAASSPDATMIAAETPPVPAGPIGYRVVDVAADDVLNVRAGPSAREGIVGTFPFDATGVVVISQYRHDAWWEVLLADGTTGWANSRYLAVDEAWTAPFAALPCAGTDASWGATQASPPPAAGSNADFVAGYEYLSGPVCDRLVVRLGSRFGVAAAPGDYPSRAADRVPAGIEVTTEGNHVVMTLPLDVGYGATTADFGEALLVVGDADYGTDGLTVKAHLIYGAERFAHARFLDDPARIVVDVLPAPYATGVDLAPVMEGSVILTEPARWDGRVAGTEPPLTITGFGTAYESQVWIGIERADGAPAAARWTGGFDCTEDFGAPTAHGDSYCTMTSGDRFWGGFAVTIDDLTPGDFELSIAGECMADEVGEEACAAAVFRHEFTVGDAP